MTPNRPFVAMACLCEYTLQEQDNVWSAIRIVDQFTLHIPEKMPEGAKGAHDIKALIGLKTQGLAGDHTVTVEVVYPSGKRKPLPTFNLKVKGSEEYEGHNIAIKLMLEVKEFGLYWMDVAWDGELLTRIPFRIIRGVPPAETAPN